MHHFIDLLITGLCATCLCYFMYYALEASIQQIYNLHIDTGQEDAAVACAGGRGGGAAGRPRSRHR